MKKGSVSGFLIEIIQSTLLTALILLTVNSANSTYSFLFFFPLSIFLYFPFFPLHSLHSSFVHSALRTPHSALPHSTLGTPKFQLTMCKWIRWSGTAFTLVLLLMCQNGLKLDTLHKYWLFVDKSNPLILKRGKCNGAQIKLMNGSVFCCKLLTWPKIAELTKEFLSFKPNKTA